MTKEDQMFLKHIEDLSKRSYYQNRPCYSDFLDMNQQSLILDNYKGSIQPMFYGGYPLAERKIVAFSESKDMIDYPVTWLEIKPVHIKFSERLTHRDYLGSVLGLGLERTCIGDILINDFSAYVLCLERVKSLIVNELYQVRHTNVSVSEIDLPEILLTPRFEVIKGSVSSIRLDAVLSLAFHLSRSQACILIESGQVYINSRLNTSNGAHLKDGDRISVRHKGKFIFVDSKNKSKKNKCIVEIHKYV